MEFPQSLLEDPTIIAKAQAAGQTPIEYLTAMRAGMVDPNRAPILSSLEVSPSMMQPQTEVAPAVSPVLSQADFEAQVEANQISGQGFRTPTIEPARPALAAPVDTLNAPVLDTAPSNRPTAMQGPQDLPAIPEGFEVLKMPTGMDQSVLFNPSTGETRPYTNSSRQLFSNPQLERDIQSLARSTYSTLNVDGPLITAQREAKAAADALAANETQENLNASLNANAALKKAQDAVQNYNPNVENATAESVQVFKNVPHGLEQVAQDVQNRPTPAPVLQPNPNEQPGADPAMYTPVPALTPNPSAMGAADPYAPPASTVDFATLEAQNSKSPVLINTTTPTTTTTANTQTNAAPVLGTKSSTATRTPALSRGAGNMTANARGSALGMIPRGEALIRIGAAGYSGALQGDGIGAAGREYGSIQDANRKAEVDAYNKAEATRIAELRARGKGKGKTGNLAGPPTAVYKQATLSAITRIKDLLASESGFNPFDNLTGWTGSLLSAVPGTPAHDAFNSINTIEAAVGFDRLQKMRDDSPTGGALGQVTERELALLSQSLGSLKQSSSREQFVDNLEAVEKHYQAAVAAVEAQQAEWYRMNGGTMPAKPTAAPSNDNLTDQELSYINQS